MACPACRLLPRMAVLSAALTLMACAAPERLEYYHDQPVVVSEANIYPQTYRTDILAFLRTYLNDPTHIRGAFIAEPALLPAGPTKRYGVCLRFDARKAGGAYEGSKDRVVFFLSGKLDTMIEAKHDECTHAAFRPFPELERLTR
jgi:hypothetical protein